MCSLDKYVLSPAQWEVGDQAEDAEVGEAQPHGSCSGETGKRATLHTRICCDGDKCTVRAAPDSGRVSLRAGDSEMMLVKKRWEIPRGNAGQVERKHGGSSRLGQQELQRPRDGKQPSVCVALSSSGRLEQTVRGWG